MVGDYELKHVAITSGGMLRRRYVRSAIFSADELAHLVTSCDAGHPTNIENGRLFFRNESRS